MIGGSACWRFIEPIAEAGYFEDEVVEHLGTLHRARRRVFSPKLTGDEIAFTAIQAQAHRIAAISHPAIPRFYGSEVADGHYTIVHELIAGRPVLGRSGQPNQNPTAEWADVSLRLVELISSLEPLRIDASRLRINQIVANNRGALRFATVWALGSIAKQQLEQSPVLARLVGSPYGGVFVSEDEPDIFKSLDGIQHALYHLALGRDNKSLEQAIDEDRRALELSAGAPLPSSLGTEKAIGDLILSIHRPDGSREITSLPALAMALRRLKGRTSNVAVATPVRGASTGERRTPRLESAAPPPQRVPPSSSAPALDFQSSSAFPPPSDSPAIPGYVAPPTPRARPVAIDQSVKAEMPQYTKPAEEYEEEIADILYPKRPDQVASASGVTVKISALPSAPSRLGRQLLTVAVVLAVLVAVVFGAIYLKDNLKTRLDRPPIALITNPPQFIRMLDKLALDAGKSSDPEGNPLTYHWRINNLATGPDFLLQPNDNHEAKTATVQFFVTGTMTIELRVFDGSLYSEPVKAIVEVRNK